MKETLTYTILEYIENIDIRHNILQEKHFDCIISGGGLKGYYIFGICKILKKMHDEKLINVRKYVCVSAGAIIMTYLLCNVPMIHSIQMYHDLKGSTVDLHSTVIESMNKLLPENAHKLCNGRIHIVVSKITLLGFEKIIVTNFTSKQHLINVLSAAIFLPYVTSNNISGILIDNNRYFDGWFNGNIPYINDNDIPQLVIETHNVDYNSKHTFSLTDNCPELLIIKGAIEMEQFINNKHISFLPIKWYVEDNKQILNIFTVPLIMLIISFIKN